MQASVVGSSDTSAAKALPQRKSGTIMMKEKINGFVFYYDPAEITIDSSIRSFLTGFRTDDGEDCFTLTRDEKGLVIY